MSPIDSLLVLGATMRLSRLVVRDDLGQWWVKDPVDALFHPAGERPPVLPERHHKYVEGFSCPFCVGYWSGVLMLSSYLMTRRHPRVRRVWRFAAATLALNEVTGHLAVRLGDTADEE